jgi:UDP:flavonoid glycosyltransferase YjiC (YdhE family)
MLEQPAADATWAPPFADLSLPLVHVSMGTVAPAAMTLPVIQAAIDGLADCDFNVFVTLPRAADQPWSSEPPADAGAPKLPANTVVQPFTRHAAVMPHTSVFITHAGLGSVGAALSHGVPMVCVPLFLEQPDNAAHVEALGAGRVLPTSASSADVRAAVEDVLSNPSYAAAARQVAEEVRPLGNGAFAVRELERLLPR